MNLEKRGGYAYPPSQTPWQEIQRSMVEQFAEGMVLSPAVGISGWPKPRGCRGTIISLGWPLALALICG